MLLNRIELNCVSETSKNVTCILHVRYVGGKLNVCYNAVDCHVESGRGDQPAIIYESPVSETKQIITYKELLQQV